MAIPGSVVSSGNLVAPGGEVGPGAMVGTPGINAATLSTADFTVPAYGSTVSVTVQDASWVVLGEMLQIATGGGMMRVTAKAGNVLTLLNPNPPSPFGDMLKSTYDTNNSGMVDATESVSWSGLTGKPAGFPPSAHATTHKSGGTDLIALDTLNTPTDITTLNVSTSAHGLCPKAPNDITQALRGDGLFNILPARNYSRYIRQRICDSPLMGNDVSTVSGAGAAITTGVQAGTTNNGHFGMWSLTPGTAANGYVSLQSSATGSAEYYLNIFTKLALRFVFKIGSVAFAGNSAIYLGLTDTLNSQPAPFNNLILWGSVGTTWGVNTANGSSTGSINISPTLNFAVNTWYDLRIYWQSGSGVMVKGGVYGGSFSTSSFVTSFLPSVATPMYWNFYFYNAVATTAPIAYLNFYEIVGETGTPMLLGDTLITNF